jgi:archaellum component FlaC
MPHNETFETKVVSKLTRIEDHLEVYNMSLEKHIKRTEQLENRVEHIENHVKEVGGAIKLVRSLAWGLSVLVGVLAVLKALGFV